MNPQKKSVLVADDDRDFLDLLARRLDSLGLEVRTADSGRKALEMAIDRLPDLVCLDANMPAGDGFSVCEVLARDDEASQIPIIIITGRKDRETIRRCHDMCAYYLCKSNRMWEALEAIVFELLDIGPIDAKAKISTDTPPNSNLFGFRCLNF